MDTRAIAVAQENLRSELITISDNLQQPIEHG